MSPHSILGREDVQFERSLNRQNDRVYAKSRQEANENGGLLLTKNYPTKVMVWVGLAFNGKYKVVILLANESFNGDFYVKNVLPIVNRDGRKLTKQKKNFICIDSYLWAFEKFSFFSPYPLIKAC